MAVLRLSHRSRCSAGPPLPTESQTFGSNDSRRKSTPGFELRSWRPSTDTLALLLRSALRARSAGRPPRGNAGRDSVLRPDPGPWPRRARAATRAARPFVCGVVSDVPGGPLPSSPSRRGLKPRAHTVPGLRALLGCSPIRTSPYRPPGRGPGAHGCGQRRLAAQPPSPAGLQLGLQRSATPLAPAALNPVRVFRVPAGTAGR